MSPDSTTVSIRAGHLEGVAFWDPVQQTYRASLIVFDSSGSYPPPTVGYGRRPREFVTVDALSNRLSAAGLALDDDSLIRLQELAQAVNRRCGHSEIVGLATGSNSGRLFLRSPDRSVIELNPAVGHDRYGFGWAQTGERGDLAAEAIVERCFLPAAREDLYTFALTLRVEYLDTVVGDFSLNAASLCDWYLADAPLVTTIDDAGRRQLRCHLAPDPESAASGRSVSALS